MHLSLSSLVALTLSLAALLSATAVEPPTTLQIDPIGPVPTCTRSTKKGDTVSMHYRGTLYSDGSKFDASYDRGTPLTFELGAGRVIKGWDEGLVGMCIGEKRKLTIPPDMAYGKRAMGPIPAGSTLVFETELVGILGVKKDEL